MTAQAGDTFFLSPATQKKSLRRELRKRRAALSHAERSRAARLTAQRLMRYRRLQRARSVGIYLSMADELDTAPLIGRLRRCGAELFAPRVNRRGQMFFLPLPAHRRLREDALGLAAPPVMRRRRSPRRFDVLILPLVGFDARGARLGMGKGYYDRACGYKRIGARPWLVGYALPCQEVETLPVEAWDLRLDVVALSGGCRRLRPWQSSCPSWQTQAL